MNSTVTVDAVPDALWARWVSNILSPPVIWGVLAFPLAARGDMLTAQHALWAAIYVVFACIVPSLYVVVMVLRGSITDIHMRVRTQRVRPFLVSIVCIALAWVILRTVDADPLLQVFALISLIEIVAMLAITLFWQISIHMMSVCSAVMVIGVLFGVRALIIAAPLILLVGAARYTLKRHTLAQLIAGGALGGGLTLALISLLINL